MKKASTTEPAYFATVYASFSAGNQPLADNINDRGNEIVDTAKAIAGEPVETHDYSGRGCRRGKLLCYSVEDFASLRAAGLNVEVQTLDWYPGAPFERYLTPE